jgi:hypothetical protein
MGSTYVKTSSQTTVALENKLNRKPFTEFQEWKGNEEPKGLITGLIWA